MTQVDRVLLAAPRSFCAGVEMAIKALAWMVRMYDPPVYCYHEIVHNRIVVDRFRQAGVVFVDDITRVPVDAPVMLSAHGSSPEVVQTAYARSQHVVDAACPLVKKVHHEVRRRSGSGHVVVYVGHRDHDEALGTLAVAPEATHLVSGPDDVADLPDFDAPVAFLAQTTLAVEEWQETLEATRDRFGPVWLPGRSDLCFATTNRQAAVRAAAPRCDAFVVIGSANSSNTSALAQVAGGTTAGRVLRVDRPDDLPADLTGTVGVTAGASAPEDLVHAVVERLGPRHGVEVIDVTTEDEYFPPPRELRDLLRAADAADALDGDRGVAASDVLARLGDPDLRIDAPGPHPPTDARDHLGAYSAPVDREIAQVVEDEVEDPWLRKAIGYHFGWVDERFDPLPPDAEPPGGKKLRATLAVLAYRVLCPDRPDTGLERVLPFAAAVEMIHNWSLIHDDIEDGDRTRRGRPALWTLCGQAQAINAGDCVHALALRCLGRLGARNVPDPDVAHLMGRLAGTAVELTVGQMRDIAYETATDVDVDDYLAMITGKTGALMACATYGGAFLGSGDPVHARAFGEFGHRLGLGFQIRDDILGIWGADRETGKPTGSDVRRRKKTLPVLLACDHAEPDGQDRLRRFYEGEGPPAPEVVSEIVRTLDSTGARDLAQQEARRQCRAAMDALAPYGATADDPAAPYVAALRSLARFATTRTY